ncbi:amidohydrolase [Phytohabitans rumicis]|uniref:Amidohydrolase n=1 Tax=Phytohabitans rumicis TaxID=1076125 RepID=A0A6V8LCD4_9ACTN|nr:amidohydrolase [Phytohabitans rumicis]
MPLVDHHVHGALRRDLTRAEFESSITESDRPVPAWISTFDSSLGFAVRRWCAPVLDLPPYADPSAYVERRRELGAAEVNRRFLGGAGVARFLVETGFRGEELLDPAGMAAAARAKADEVVRLETVAEELAGVAAADFAPRYAERLAERAGTAVGLKTVVAYRHGLDFDPARPSAREVTAAAGDWLRAGGGRLTDPVLLRHVIWAGVDSRLPLQVHTGFGDPDLRLHRADPLLLTGFLEQVEPTGVPVLLLHCYPYHRQAAYLAHAYPHVHFDVGLALNYVGAAASTVLAEALELAPYAKVLYSSDAWGPAELHYLGALLWRRAMSAVARAWAWPAGEAARVAEMMGSGNARRVYRLRES